jgi:hypothetical protein
VHAIFLARRLPSLVPGSRWPTVAAAVCAFSVGLSGAAFLTYHWDGYCLVMALGFDGAMFWHAITLYLVGRPAQAKGA